MPLNVPMILTLLRIALIPVFVLAFYIPLFGINNYVVTVIFFIAGITDWFDGYLARKWNQQSKFGAFLDPVADKLMVATALVLLVSKHPTLWLAIPTVIIIGREITISALREWMANIGDNTKVAVSIIGKIKTAAQMWAIGFLLFEVPLFDVSTLAIGYLLLYMAAILTLWSMVIYLQAAWPSLTSQTDSNKG
ncbi:MAG: CDP-diacylglycerol--glycerol-3-phosphate 3-phosphatidyltransferase [Thioalkalispiraceae bacterium]|jgi:CDP-diacylglycerol--glycerol-3-phosphate 3-phosphatidyltransferase